MTEHPKFKTLDPDTLNVGIDKVTKGYLPIKVRTLFPETLVPFDIYCLAHRSDQPGIRLDQLFPRDRFYPLSFHRHLIEEAFDDAFIKLDDEEAFGAYLNDHGRKALEGRDLPAQQRASVLYDQAEFVIKKVFRQRPSRRNIAIGQQLVGQLSEHALNDEATLKALFALFSSDYYTFSHCFQVAVYGMCLGKFLGWRRKEIEAFGLGAMFHDIGKTSIHEEILNKPGKLDEAEFELVKRHSLMGYQQLKKTQMMTRDQLSIVLHHHEAEDGSGYPYHLKGGEIHKFARVARIADIYDALTTKRPYKEAFSMQKALQIMNNQMKHTLDRHLFAAFTKMKEAETNMTVINLDTLLDIEAGTRVELQLEGRTNPVQGELAGQEAGRALMFRIAAGGLSGVDVKRGIAVIGKYVRGGTLHKFRSLVLKTIRHPYVLLILSYPQDVRSVPLHQEVCVGCAIRAKAFIGKTLYPGTVTELSQDGCRLAVKCSAQVVVVNENISIAMEIPQNGLGEPMIATVRSVKEDQEQTILEVQLVDLSSSAREAIDFLYRNWGEAEQGLNRLLPVEPFTGSGVSVPVRK